MELDYLELKYHLNSFANSRNKNQKLSKMKSQAKDGNPLSSLTVIPVRSKRRFGKFDLAEAVWTDLRRQGVRLQTGDILVVSSKFAAMAEGRFVKLSQVKPSKKARKLADAYHIDPSFAELILNESEVILGGISGFVLAVSKGILAPNAGIDRSNVPPGFAILYPKDPQEAAEKLRSKLIRHAPFGNDRNRARLGVVLSDSRITPTRLGTIGIAIAAAGFSPVIDFRGFSDLFGNKLKVTVRAVADELASSAQLVMGEAAESVPIVVVRGCKVEFKEDERTGSESNLSMQITHEKCLYIQGLKNEFKV